MQQPGAKKSAPPNTLQGQCGLYDFSLLFSSLGNSATHIYASLSLRQSSISMFMR
jgi:hypothetical protein